MITYRDKGTFVHGLSGFVKLVFFLLWTLTAMLTYDTRVLVAMLIISFVLFAVSHTGWAQVSTVIKAIIFFLSINIVAIFLFSPYEGCKIYESRTELLHLAGNYTLTAEQIFYEANIILKYFTIVPPVLIFITATNPSEFASSLNKIGIPYTICYAVSLAMRYIPDVQDDYTKIRNAQAARGIEFSAKASLINRFKAIVAILFPLIFTGMERIDTVSCAMELRGFGKKKKRTWYSGKPLTKKDVLVLILTVLFSGLALFVTFSDGSRFFNPFRH